MRTHRAPNSEASVPKSSTWDCEHQLVPLLTAQTGLITTDGGHPRLAPHPWPHWPHPVYRTLHRCCVILNVCWMWLGPR